ncbi:MAG: serine/threonine-protein kinase [Myxococcota bacterium]
MIPAQDLGHTLAGRRLGRYEVLTQLATGGMATVYVARAVGMAGFERLVAVKVLHPHLAHEEEFITMFLDEARLAARIRHPNVVATLDISDSDGAGFFLVMDYIEGDHQGALLRESSRQGERLPAPVVARIVLDALAGLRAAHQLTDERGQLLHLVHRDISPHNILIGTDGIARLTDFGVAKAEVRLSSTREGQFKGKLGYMAPEHASTGEADQRSDLFSMGIVLWESLTGKRLFRGENNAATLNLILQGEIRPVGAFAPELAPYEAVLGRALARPPQERFQTAEEFMDALEAAAQQGGGVAAPRLVGEAIRQYCGEKIHSEKDRVRGAIDQLGYANVAETPMPLPRDGSNSFMPRRPGAPEDATQAERPSARPAGNKKGSWLLLGVFGFLLISVGIVGIVLGLAASDTPADPAPEVETGSAPEVSSPTPTMQPTDLEMLDVPTRVEETHIEPAAMAVDQGDDRERQRRRERRERRRDRQAEAASMEPATQPAEETPAPMMVIQRTKRASDDLILNPYRR